jgi:histidine ammonia-lyase
MGAGAALKARQIARHLRQVLAIELLVAAQALDLRAPLAPGAGSRIAHAVLRKAVPPLDTDRFLSGDLTAALAVVEGTELIAAVESAVGPLA